MRTSIGRLAAMAALTLLGTSMVGLSSASAALPAPVLTPGNSAQVMHLTQPGRTVRLAFQGTSGRVPTVQIIDDSLAHPVSVTLIRPNGTTASSATFSSAWFHTFAILDVTGTWSLALTPSAGDTGDIGLLLSYAAAPIKKLTVGSTQKVALPAPGEVQAFTFTAIAGRRPTMSSASSTWHSAYGETRFPAAGNDLYRPDGSLWGGYQTVCGGCPNVFHEAISPTGPFLDGGGTWTMVFRAAPDAIGTENFIFRLLADQARAITPGASTTVSVANPGQVVNYTFNGTAGQRPVVDLLDMAWKGSVGSSNSKVPMALLRPDGTYFDGWAPWFQGGDPITWYESAVLDVSGRWTLTVDPEDDIVGSQRMIFNLVKDPVARPITLGAAVTVNSTIAGANADLTLPGVPGSPIILTVTSASFRSRTAGNRVGTGTATVRLLDSSGQESGFGSLPASGSGVVDFSGTPPTGGPWTLRVDPDTDTTGSVTFSASVPTDPTAR